MKLLCFKNRFFLIFLFFEISLFAFSPKSAVIYYAKDKPYEILGDFDIVILDPDNTDSNNFGFKKYREKIFAYVSMCEVSKNRSYFKDIKKDWILSKNRVWKSEILDISNPDYRKFLLNRVIKSLVEKGYKNIFFDTVDSYRAVKVRDYRKFEDSIVKFLKDIKLKYPSMKIILNRGFEVLDRAHFYIDGVLFESLFRGLDPKTLEYREIEKRDREWLLGWVKKIKKYGLFVISVDYLPLGDKRAKDVVKKIKSYGIIPYIGEKDLQSIGISANNPIKRRVLILYNSFFENKEDSLAFHFAPFLEYFGFIPEFFNIEKKDINRIKLDRYNGVILYFPKYLKNGKNIKYFLKRASKFHIKTLLLGEIFSSFPDKEGVFKVKKRIFLKFDKYFVFNFDPFKVFKKAFTPNFPVPDVTTKMGRRVVFAIVGCKGFENICEYKNIRAFDAFKREIFKKFRKIPHSVCIPKSKTPLLEGVERNTKFKKSFTYLTASLPFLTLVSPIGVWQKGEFEIYAPIGDDIYYTNWWQKRFWGYERVISTFKLTNMPKRLKPICINYNYLSLTKKASLNALKKVYLWSMKQKIYPLFPSFYKKSALDFYYVAIEKKKKSFLIKGADFLKTFRIPEKIKIDLKNSDIKNISYLKQGIYIDISKKEALVSLK